MNKEEKAFIVKQLIAKYSCLSKNSPNSFLSHIDYFKGTDGKISASSISKKWTQLTGENSMMTYAKGMAVIQSANSSKEANGCPYRFEFKSSHEIMPCLKHSRDTGIVNKDGSININVLEYVLMTYFEYSAESQKESKLILSQTKMHDYLEECNNRDKHLPATGILFVPYKTVSKGEWDSFFVIFGDIKINGDLYITAETFMLFYFDSATLYEKKLKSQSVAKIQTIDKI